MSGTGTPAGKPIDGKGRRVAIIAARWHPEITDALIDGALKACVDCGVRMDEDAEVIRVPGAFELPLVASAAARSKRFDAIVCLGAVVRGGTPHFDYVCRAVTDGCTRVALDTGIPVGFGVLTVDTVQQALDRAGGSEGNKGGEAMLAALETACVLDVVHGGVHLRGRGAGHRGAGLPAAPSL
ncbi:MAG TPA: 6,7-dimethyl-8-ribityllumazine synthase [Mycobacteriales bacterium]|nr:6,7-dimethyl-8-ribityllumazine synthase [Mycobacteriales bacterium]